DLDPNRSLDPPRPRSLDRLRLELLGRTLERLGGEQVSVANFSLLAGVSCQPAEMTEGDVDVFAGDALFASDLVELLSVGELDDARSAVDGNAPSKARI